MKNKTIITITLFIVMAVTLVLLVDRHKERAGGTGSRPSMQDTEYSSIKQLPVICKDYATANQSFEDVKFKPPPLRVDQHYLTDNLGKRVFILADTAWLLTKLDREGVVSYLQNRKSLGFNAVLFTVEFDANFQGDEPFLRDKNNQYDVTRPLLTKGDNPDNKDQYDYWDHLRYITEQTLSSGFYIILSMGISPGISGDYSGNGNTYIDTLEKAYAVGNFEGCFFSRYSDKIIFMTLDDRAPEYINKKNKINFYRAVFEGLADGINHLHVFDGIADYSTSIITAMPRKKDPSSSFWFHNDPAIDINAIQAWPADAVERVLKDFSRKTDDGSYKPTFVAENRYEGYDNGIWNDWGQRYQIYTSVFAGGLGAVYGHTDYDVDSKWHDHLSAPGAQQIHSIFNLMALINKESLMTLVPDQSMIGNKEGELNNQTFGGDRIQAMRDGIGSIALFYTMNGREISVRMEKLNGPTMKAWWYNPRTSKFLVDGKELEEKSDDTAFASAIVSGANAENRRFMPPGTVRNGNDWVLILEKAKREDLK